ncbi:hypothetical protein ACFW1F_24160 [Streptomyces bungoensis]|uniref:hypothetical protein n=1 Tax=Streptomyces bungoensis TaxID=285568 RepID=UPI003441239F
MSGTGNTQRRTQRANVDGVGVGTLWPYWISWWAPEQVARDKFCRWGGEYGGMPDVGISLFDQEAGEVLTTWHEDRYRGPRRHWASYASPVRPASFARFSQRIAPA